MFRNVVMIAALTLLSTSARAEVRGQVEGQPNRGGFRSVSEDEQEEENEDGQEEENEDEGGEEGEEGWIVIADDESEEEGEDEERSSSDRFHQRDIDPDDPWVVQTDPWPLFEISFIGAPIIRLFSLPIDGNVDTLGGHRELAHLETGYFGIVGFNLTVFPFARFDSPAIRGLGAEWSMGYGLGLEIENINGIEGEVDASYEEIEFGLVYTGMIGRLDVGAQISGRLGWHRTRFYLGNMNNDLIPPFEYEALRIDIGARVPLRTRHLLAEARCAYLFVPSPGPVATQAYGDGSDPSTHGAEIRVGLIARAGGLELSFMYVGRWFMSNFQGVGFGYGEDPSTKLSTGGSGIQPTDTAKDGFQQLRFSLGYRW